MATINDLKSLQEKPKNLDEWLGRFTVEDRETVAAAILKHQPAEVHKVLVELEGNPYPFTKSALSSHRKRLMGAA